MSSIENQSTIESSPYSLAMKCILPNESVTATCEIQNGFLFLTDRRLVQVNASGILSYTITRSIPYDCISGINRKRDSEIDIIAKPVDIDGNLGGEGEIRISLKAPRHENIRSKEEAYTLFQSNITNLMDRLVEIQEIEKAKSTPKKRNYSYLDNLPNNLTKDAVLDLNAILQDKPYPDELYHEAAKFLGRRPFLIEESLRDCDDMDNGILFAAGEKGCIWVRGIKRGRFMKNVLVETIGWENIGCLVHQWQHPNDTMNFIYVLQQQGAEKYLCTSWNPTIYEDVMTFPWLIQSSNGPWIIADLMNRYSGLRLKTVHQTHIQNSSRLIYYL